VGAFITALANSPGFLRQAPCCVQRCEQATAAALRCLTDERRKMRLRVVLRIHRRAAMQAHIGVYVSQGRRLGNLRILPPPDSCQQAVASSIGAC